MTTEILLSQIYNNTHLKQFFFRDKAIDTLDKLLDEIDEDDREQVIDIIDDCYDELEELDEDLYNLTVDGLIKKLDLNIED